MLRFLWTFPLSILKCVVVRTQKKKMKTNSCCCCWCLFVSLYSVFSTIFIFIFIFHCSDEIGVRKYAQREKQKWWRNICRHRNITVLQTADVICNHSMRSNLNASHPFGWIIILQELINFTFMCACVCAVFYLLFVCSAYRRDGNEQNRKKKTETCKHEITLECHIASKGDLNSFSFSVLVTVAAEFDTLSAFQLKQSRHI